MAALRSVCLLTAAALALAAGSAYAQRTAPTPPTGRPLPAPSPKNNSLRCVRSDVGRVTIYNGGPAVLPKGTDILVSAFDADGKPDGQGGVPTDVELAVGAKWLEPIKFGAPFTHCDAKITHVPG